MRWLLFLFFIPVYSANYLGIATHIEQSDYGAVDTRLQIHNPSDQNITIDFDGKDAAGIFVNGTGYIILPNGTFDISVRTVFPSDYQVIRTVDVFSEHHFSLSVKRQSGSISSSEAIRVNMIDPGPPEFLVHVLTNPVYWKTPNMPLNIPTFMDYGIYQKDTDPFVIMENHIPESGAGDLFDIRLFTGMVTNSHLQKGFGIPQAHMGTDQYLLIDTDFISASKYPVLMVYNPEPTLVDVTVQYEDHLRQEIDNTVFALDGETQARGFFDGAGGDFSLVALDQDGVLHVTSTGPVGLYFIYGVFTPDRTVFDLDVLPGVNEFNQSKMLSLPARNLKIVGIMNMGVNANYEVGLYDYEGNLEGSGSHFLEAGKTYIGSVNPLTGIAPNVGSYRMSSSSPLHMVGYYEDEGREFVQNACVLNKGELGINSSRFGAIDSPLLRLNLPVTIFLDPNFISGTDLMRNYLVDLSDGQSFDINSSSQLSKQVTLTSSGLHIVDILGYRDDGNQIVDIATRLEKYASAQNAYYYNVELLDADLNPIAAASVNVPVNLRLSWVSIGTTDEIIYNFGAGGSRYTLSTPAKSGTTLIPVTAGVPVGVSDMAGQSVVTAYLTLDNHLTSLGDQEAEIVAGMEEIDVLPEGVYDKDDFYSTNLNQILTEKEEEILNVLDHDDVLYEGTARLDRATLRGPVSASV